MWAVKGKLCEQKSLALDSYYKTKRDSVKRFSALIMLEAGSTKRVLWPV